MAFELFVVSVVVTPDKGAERRQSVRGSLGPIPSSCGAMCSPSRNPAKAHTRITTRQLKYAPKLGGAEIVRIGRHAEMPASKLPLRYVMP